MATSSDFGHSVVQRYCRKARHLRMRKFWGLIMNIYRQKGEQWMRNDVNWKKRGGLLFAAYFNQPLCPTLFLWAEQKSGNNLLYVAASSKPLCATGRLLWRSNRQESRHLWSTGYFPLTVTLTEIRRHFQIPKPIWSFTDLGYSTWRSRRLYWLTEIAM